MRNPFRSEAAAFRFVLVTVVAFGAIAAAAAVGGVVAALVVWIVVTALVAAAYARGRRARTLPSAPAHIGTVDERRVLVVAPVAASRLQRLSNDTDRARAEARERALAAVRACAAPNVAARSVVGDDSVVAVADALRTFGGDEIVVLPGDERLAERLRERYALPVTAPDE